MSRRISGDRVSEVLGTAVLLPGSVEADRSLCVGWALLVLVLGRIYAVPDGYLWFGRITVYRAAFWIDAWGSILLYVFVIICILCRRVGTICAVYHCRAG